MNVTQTVIFRSAYKRLASSEKEIVNLTIQTIFSNPSIGVEKKQDLQGVFVYKFLIHSQPYLLGYTYDSYTLLLLFLGRDMPLNVENNILKETICLCSKPEFVERILKADDEPIEEGVPADKVDW